MDLDQKTAEAVYDFDPMGEVGTVGIRRAGGIILEEFLPELQGNRGMLVYREMGSNDPVVAAMLAALRLNARQVAWFMTPADESDEARRISEFCEQAMYDMLSTWESTLGSMMSFLQYGWFVGEITVKQRLGMDPGRGEDGRPLPKSKFRDNLYGLHCVEPRLQETLQDWVYDGDECVGMRQTDPNTGRTAIVPLSKAVHLTTTAERGSPEGVSILRAAYLPWYMKRRLQELEAIGVERDLVGMPIAYVPATTLREGATAGEKAVVQKVRDAVTKVRRNETDGLIFPAAYDDDGHELYQFKLLTSGGSRQFDIGAVVNRYDSRILLAGLTDFLLLGHAGVSGLGVTSIGATKVDLLNAALESYVQLIGAEITTKVLPMLVRLNGWAVNLTPTWAPGKVDVVDLDQLGNYLVKLSQAGMMLFPNPELEEHLSHLADLPYDPDAQSELPAGVAGPDGATLDLREKAMALGTLIRTGVDPDVAAGMVGLPDAQFIPGAQPVTLRFASDDTPAAMQAAVTA